MKHYRVVVRVGPVESKSEGFGGLRKKKILSIVLGTIRRCSEERGFTLVEILTVVAILEHR